MVDTATKRALATELLTSCGEARLPVGGSSMFPALRPGDLLDVRRDATIQPGDLVVFERHGRLVTHRVIASNGTLVVTQGDRLRYPDEPVLSTDVLGRVERVIRRGRPARTHKHRMLSWLLSRSELATRVALYLVRP